MLFERTFWRTVEIDYSCVVSQFLFSLFPFLTTHVFKIYSLFSVHFTVMWNTFVIVESWNLISKLLLSAFFFFGGGGGREGEGGVSKETWSIVILHDFDDLIEVIYRESCFCPNWRLHSTPDSSVYSRVPCFFGSKVVDDELCFCWILHSWSWFRVFAIVKLTRR